MIGRSRLVCAAFAALALTMAAAVPAALAAPDEPFVLVGSFDASATPDGAMEAATLAVNQAAGHVLVMDTAHAAVLQFDESGNPVDFSSTGTPKVALPAAGELFIDNSGTGTQGNFYVLHQGTSVEGFAASGAPLPGWPVAASSAGFLQTINVDHGGDIWFSYFNQEDSKLEEHNASGAATGKTIGSIGYHTPGEIRMDAANFVFDSHDNLIYGVGGGAGGVNPIYRKDAAENYNTRRPLVANTPLVLKIDPSNDDEWFSHPNHSISGTRFTEPLALVAPFETLPGIVVGGFDFAADGQTLFQSEGSKVNIFKRQPPTLPKVAQPLRFTGVKAEGTFAFDTVDTGGGADITYRFEFASQAEWEATGEYQHSYPSSGYSRARDGFGPQVFSNLLDGLQPLTIYHVRVSVTNATGTGYSPDAILKTLPPGDSGSAENCPLNALARKQTGATALPDCRAYELVSAPYTGGYDVEAPMVPGQEPFGGYPSADGRVLYGVHAGVVPGPWNPTNRGVDPYVAVRGENGWTTEYVGLPAELSPDKSPFSSDLGGADADLHTFAFAGPKLCDPCFAQTPETGIPLRLPNGELIQAMAGDNPPSSNIKPEGQVAKMVSADGRHLVFGSQSPLVAGANSSDGNLNIFDRNLATGHTQLVSKTAGAAIQAGMGVSELDLSNDGSRILLGVKASTDAAGNEYARLYMHVGESPDSVELTPGFTQGALFAGMTGDGSKVFLTSKEKLLPADTDTAADLYEAAVDATGGVTLSLLTPGAGGPCNPVANNAGAHWNTVDGTADCGAVAIGGGAGIASSSGAAFVLSPEKLDGSNGVPDQPNLFEIAPDGTFGFVSTLSPNDPLVVDSTRDAGTSAAHDLQTTPDGAVATFRSTLALTGVTNSGQPSIYVYRGAGKPLECASCNPTLTDDPTQQGVATLAGNGLSITDDGRVFFNTDASLGVEDTGGNKDVYEWIGGRPRLISSGISRFDSELLTVSHDGTDAFFFTHDTLDAKIDRNGERTKIYDARENGGLFALPQAPGCAASDECHGPGTVAPGPPQIGSSGPTSDGNEKAKGCPKGKRKVKGKCVKPKHKHTKNHKKRKRHHA